jgi:carbon starvation protein CstA
VQSTLLQALGAGMWLLLRTFGIARAAIFLALAAAMLSGFAFTHGLYTWPKLLPVAYVAVVTAVALSATRETLADPPVAVACGAAIALACCATRAPCSSWRASPRRSSPCGAFHRCGPCSSQP